MTQKGNKQLVLMRHAKSDWSDFGLDDHERPLNMRGQHDAPRMGAWLSHKIDCPQNILCSSAVRTQATIQLVADGAGWQQQLTEVLSIHDNLYHATAGSIAAYARDALAVHDHVMIVGHNPGMEVVLRHFYPQMKLPDDGKWMPTACVAVLEFSAQDAHFVTPELTAFMRPKWLTT